MGKESMKILQKLFVSIIAVIFAQNIHGYSYGVDSYFNEPRYLKLHFRTCRDSNPIYVPAYAKGMPLEYSGGGAGCCIKGIEMLDKDKKSIDFLRVGINKISVFEDGEILPWHSNTAWNDILCGNRNFVIDKHGRLGIWGSCDPIDNIPGWACVDISQSTEHAVGKRATKLRAR